ncbi:hypothetical protein EVAR_59046_1 [Eumeta japonica]|uniref:Mos1 transposase HTH domain-containing protein n=1 Tax=Eumeta variegata TaxID=151549 RepID=A0A4C1YFD8_EUMVA|nr:hypothetical protein EVAR_59046_1 [Eumeta japonica]
MISYDFKCNLTAHQSLARLRTAFSDEAPYKVTIYNWFAEFKRGRISLSDEFHDGHPYIAVNNKNIDDVHRMIEIERCVTYHEIWTSFHTINPPQTFSNEKSVLDTSLINTRLDRKSGRNRVVGLAVRSDAVPTRQLF